MGSFMTMEIFKVASLLVFFFFYMVFSFPSRPLNERSTELAWQAWLLVDDQNQNKHYENSDGNIPRRRITPKSVFIAPTFSPESLPACAEGYRPDPMGRCIKIIKLDEEAHLDFLLEKLNAQFGNYDEDLEDEESQEDLPTAGPFQLNIPLGEKAEENTKDQSSNLDIAIVVAPTNGNFDLDDFKSGVKRTGLNGNSEIESKPTPPTVQESPHNFDQVNNNLKRKTEAEVQTTTSTTVAVDETTTVLSSSSESNPPTTTIFDLIEESTIFTTPIPSIETESTTLEVEDATVNDDQQALFFLKQSLTNTGHVENGTNNTKDTPLSSNDSVIISNDGDSLTTVLSNSTTFVVNATINMNNKQHLPSVYNRPTGEPNNPNSMGSSAENLDLLPSENSHPNFDGFVRFPETSQQEIPAKISQNKFLPPLDTYASQFRYGSPKPDDLNKPIGFEPTFQDYINTRGADLQGSERFVFKNAQGTNFPGNFDSGQESNRRKTHANHEITNDRIVFNHRNRDKHTSLWSVPQFWSDSSPQKPIVLRFSRRSGNSRQLLEEHLRPHTQNSQAFYREVPTEDFSYIFGVNEGAGYHRKRINR